MKKMTRGTFMARWQHINSLQSELEALEGRNGQCGMTVEEIEKFLFSKGYHYARRAVAELIQPLTVPRGFTPDWSKAPSDADKVEAYWAGPDGVVSFMPMKVIHSPTHVKKMRKRTDVELLTTLVEHYQKKGVEETITLSGIALELVRGKALTDLCTAAGISLETEEG